MESAALIVMLRACVAVFDPPSVTCTVKFAVPGDPLGVPDITPPALRFKPVGRLPTVTLHVRLLPQLDAVSVCEYAVLTSPPGRLEVFTEQLEGIGANSHLASMLLFTSV